MIKSLVVLCTLSCSMLLHAETIEITKDDRRLQDEQVQDRVNITDTLEPTIAPPSISDKQNNTTLELDERQLLQHPKILNNALMAALLYNQENDVLYLLPLYQKLETTAKDKTLLLWAQAVAAQAKQDYNRAIASYRTILVSYPDNSIIRLRLAAALFQNRNFKEARSEFLRLQHAANDAPIAVKNGIEQYLNVIDQLQRWKFQAGATYLSDKNINNAPKNANLSDHFTAQKSESAYGTYMHINASKRHFVNKGLFTDVELEAHSKLYWDNQKYNELNYRASAGGGYQNAQHTVTLSPFWMQTFYAGGKEDNTHLASFSKGTGLAAQWGYKINPKWQWSLDSEYTMPRYRTRKHLDGRTFFTNTSLTYTPSDKQYWLIGAEQHRTTTQDKDDSFQRKGVRATWGQQWDNGLSSQISINYATRVYDGPMPIFNVVQDNIEYGAQASFGHKKIKWLGMQPRLTWQYNRVKSNVQLYDYDKNRLFVALDKQF